MSLWTQAESATWKVAVKQRRQLLHSTAAQARLGQSVRPIVRPTLYDLLLCHVMWLEILAAAAIILSRAQRMQLTLVYGPSGSQRPSVPFHPSTLKSLMMAVRSSQPD